MGMLLANSWNVRACKGPLGAGVPTSAAAKHPGLGRSSSVGLQGRKVSPGEPGLQQAGLGEDLEFQAGEGCVGSVRGPLKAPGAPGETVPTSQPALRPQVAVRSLPGAQLFQ